MNAYQLAPYVRNCPTGHWTGRATTYLTIQPIKGDKREEFVKRAFDELKTDGLCLMREADFDGRVQLILFTPSPTDPIVTVEDENTMYEAMIEDEEEGQT